MRISDPVFCHLPSFLLSGLIRSGQRFHLHHINTNLATNVTAFRNAQESTFWKSLRFPCLVAFLKAFFMKPRAKNSQDFFVSKFIILDHKGLNLFSRKTTESNASSISSLRAIFNLIPYPERVVLEPIKMYLHKVAWFTGNLKQEAPRLGVGGALAITAYTGRIRFRYMKRWNGEKGEKVNMWKGREICHLGIEKSLSLKYLEYTYPMTLLF